MLLNSDPVGRLSGIAQALYGVGGAWGGAALNAEYRRWPVTLGGDLFWTRQNPAVQEGDLLNVVSGRDYFQTDYAGATVFAEHNRDLLNRRWTARAGASNGTLNGEVLDAARHLAFAEWAGSTTWSRGRRSLAAGLDLRGGRHGRAGLGARRCLGLAWRAARRTEPTRHRHLRPDG
jgi:hypothetical protein